VVGYFDSNLVDSDDGMAGSGVLDLSHDFLSGVFADLSDEFVVEFLQRLLHHFLDLVSNSFFGLL
jgi:hypothetical protein